MDNWTGTLCADEGPDEECETGGWDDIGFDGEEVADFVDGWVDGWERDEPEEEEGEEVASIGAGRGGEAIGKAVVLRPDGGDHEGHALPACGGLRLIPSTEERNAYRSRIVLHTTHKPSQLC